MYLYDVVNKTLRLLARTFRKYTSKTKDSGQPSTLAYLRAIAFGALCWSVAAMIAPEYFWAATLLIYVGFFVLFVDAIVDRSLRLWARMAMAVLMICGCYLFTAKVVWPPDPFDKSLLVYHVPQVDGKNIPINNMIFSPEVSIVDVQIMNGSGNDYNDLRLRIYTDLWIADMLQATRHTDCEAQRGGEIPSTYFFYQNGIPKYGGQPQGQTKAWKVFCRQLRDGDKLEIILATVSSPPAFSLDGKLAPFQAMRTPKTLVLEAQYKGSFFRPRTWIRTMDIKEP